MVAIKKVCSEGIRIYFKPERQTPMKTIPKAWIVVEYPGREPKISKDLYDQNSRLAEEKIKELYFYISALF